MPLYAAWFGLQREPFSIAPDPRTLFMSERHREALAHLLYGVQGGGGFVLLTGEIGAGKTTVSRCFLEQVPEGCRVAYVFNPKQTVDELLWTIAQEFGLEGPGREAGAGGEGGNEGMARAAEPGPQGHQQGSKALVDALNRHLLQVHAQGGQAMLVIDEAQALSAEVLEQLRLLTNLETSERKLLQIILIGQPELRTMVASPGLEQLAQRVIARYHLGPLSAPDTARYVQHRLAVAGLSGPLPFDAAALKRVHERSRGVPRRINLLCDRALLGAYATGRRTVDAGIVERAAAEVDGEPLPAETAWWGAPGSLRRTAWLVGAGLVLTLGAAALASALMRQT